MAPAERPDPKDPASARTPSDGRPAARAPADGRPAARAPADGRPAARAPEPTEKSITGRLFAGVAFGLVVYALFVLWADFGRVRSALADFPLYLLPAAMGLSFLNYVVRFVRWEMYRTRLGIRLDRRTSFTIHLAGLALTVSPGKLGEAYKAWLIRRVDGTPVHTSAPIVVAERFTDLLAFLLLISISGLTSEPERAWLFWATLGACVVLLAVVSSGRASRFVLSIVRRMPLGERLAPKLDGALASTRVLLAPRLLLLPTLIATAGWTLECTAFWLVASALVPGGVPFLFAVYTFALAAVAGAVAIVFPGGLGITEASMTALLTSRYAALGVVKDLAESKAVAATLVIRLCTLWFAVGIGLVATAIFHRRFRALPDRTDAARA